MKASATKPSMNYFKNDRGLFECRICGKTSKYQANMSRHTYIHDEPPEALSTFTYNGDFILKKTEQILLWKAIHGIPISALNDLAFYGIIDAKIIYSDKTNQTIINQICDQIIEKKLQSCFRKICFFNNGWRHCLP